MAEHKILSKQLVDVWNEFLAKEKLLLEKFNLFNELQSEYKQMLAAYLDNKVVSETLNLLIQMPKQLILAGMHNETHVLDEEQFSEQVKHLYTLIVSPITGIARNKVTQNTKSLVFETTFVMHTIAITQLNLEFDSCINQIEALNQPILPTLADDPERAKKIVEMMTKLNISNIKTITYLGFVRDLLNLPTQHIARYELLFTKIIENSLTYPNELKLLEAIRKKFISFTEQVNTAQKNKSARVLTKEPSSRAVADIPANTINFLAYTLLACTYFDKKDFFNELYNQAIIVVLNPNIAGIIDALEETIERGPTDSTTRNEWEPWKLYLRNIRNIELADDSIALVRKEIIVKQSHEETGVTIFEKGKEKEFLYRLIFEKAIATLSTSAHYNKDYLDSNADKRRSVMIPTSIQKIAAHGWSSLKAKSNNKTLLILPGLRIQALVRKFRLLQQLPVDKIDKLIKKLHAPFNKDLSGLLKLKTWETLGFFGQPLPYEVDLKLFASEYLHIPQDMFAKKNFISAYAHEESVSTAKLPFNKEILVLLNVLNIIEKTMYVHADIFSEQVSPSLSGIFDMPDPIETWKELASLFKVADKAIKILQTISGIDSSQPGIDMFINAAFLELTNLIKNTKLTQVEKKADWLQANLLALLAIDKNSSQSIYLLKPMPSYIRLSTGVTPNAIEVQIQRFHIIRVYGFIFEYMLISARQSSFLFSTASIQDRFADYCCCLLQELYLMSLESRQVLMNALEQPSIIGLLKFVLNGFVTDKVQFIAEKTANLGKEVEKKFKAIYASYINNEYIADSTQLTELFQLLFEKEKPVKNNKTMQSICSFLFLLSLKTEYVARIKEIKIEDMLEDHLTCMLIDIDNYLHEMTVSNQQILNINPGK